MLRQEVPLRETSWVEVAVAVKADSGNEWKDPFTNYFYPNKKHWSIAAIKLLSSEQTCVMATLPEGLLVLIVWELLPFSWMSLCASVKTHLIHVETERPSPHGGYTLTWSIVLTKWKAYMGGSSKLWNMDSSCSTYRILSEDWWPLQSNQFILESESALCQIYINSLLAFLRSCVHSSWTDIKSKSLSPLTTKKRNPWVQADIGVTRNSLKVLLRWQVFILEGQTKKHYASSHGCRWYGRFKVKEYEENTLVPLLLTGHSINRKSWHVVMTKHQTRRLHKTPVSRDASCFSAAAEETYRADDNLCVLGKMEENSLGQTGVFVSKFWFLTTSTLSSSPSVDKCVITSESEQLTYKRHFGAGDKRSKPRDVFIHAVEFNLIQTASSITSRKLEIAEFDFTKWIWENNSSWLGIVGCKYWYKAASVLQASFREG